MSNTAGHDPLKIEAFMMMPIMNYWSILNNVLNDEAKNAGHSTKRHH